MTFLADPTLGAAALSPATLLLSVLLFLLFPAYMVAVAGILRA